MSLNQNQYVIFSLAGENYGLKIDYVETIERIMEITRVPKTPDYVKGVINLRGEIVPVIDLRSRLGISTSNYGNDTRIIVNKIDDILIGLIVDSAYEVKEIREEQIDYAFSDDGKHVNYILGIGKLDENIVVLIDIKKIINIQ